MSVALVEMTLAATDAGASARFYEAVLGITLAPTPAYGTMLYRGTVAGIGFQICPNDVAQVQAQQSRHQLVFRVSDLDAALAAVAANGGSLRERVGKRAAAVDPDGNTLELTEA